MTARVLAVGLDSADRRLYQQWMDDGKLPVLAGLCARGLYQPMTGLGHSQAEAGWTAMWSGASPKLTGYWSQFKFEPERYHANYTKHYQFDGQFPPFYALGPDYKVAAVDIPQTAIVDDVNGIQVLAYGAHSPQTPRVSEPPELLDELIDTHGDHPTVNDDFARLWLIGSLRRLRRGLLEGVKQRTKVCVDLLGRDEWDLFLTVFGEGHGAGHYLWHASQSDHPMSAVQARKWDTDPLLEIAIATDRALGELIDAAGPDCSVVVFSQEGMDPNNLDLPSMVFLPEFLHRWSLPGSQCIEGPLEVPDEAPRAMRARPWWTGWTRSFWGMAHDDRRWRRWLRKALPVEIAFRLPWLRHTAALKHPNDTVFRMQVPNWYSDHWPSQAAFALPSFSDGYVRLNVAGREAQGIVSAADYHATLDSVEEMLRGLVNSRTGEGIVREIIRTREDPYDPDPGLPDGDLVVLWDPVAADVVEHRDLGRVGPIPHKRSGGHNEKCFAVVAAEGVDQRRAEDECDATSVGAVIRTLMGAEVPGYYEGSFVGARV